MMFGYRIDLTPDNNRTFLVTCPAIPELTTYGADAGEAMRNACDALDEAIAARIAAGRDIPAFEQHSGAPGNECFATLTALSSLKAQLYQACRQDAVTRAELARRLDWPREQVDRLFRLAHRSRLDQLERAFEAIGRQIDARAVACLDDPGTRPRFLYFVVHHGTTDGWLVRREGEVLSVHPVADEAEAAALALARDDRSRGADAAVHLVAHPGDAVVGRSFHA